MLEEILLIVLRSVIPFLLGFIAVWLYYRNKNQELAENIADKSVIISALTDYQVNLEKSMVSKPKPIKTKYQDSKKKTTVKSKKKSI